MSAETFMPTDDELFRPSLTPADDAVGFSRPWSPDALTAVAFFAGPVGGGVLFAWNAHRLGIIGGVRRYSVLFAALSIVVYGGMSYLLAFDPDGDGSLHRLGERALTVVVALVAAREQRPRFRVCLGHGGEVGPLLIIGLAMIVLGLVMTFIGVWILAVLWSLIL
ncbi:MAG: hypothetical protein CMJ83_09095 [Planctomycetes bacterium]|nr:hypothetical protein [Planctomycetota bacterium]